MKNFYTAAGVLATLISRTQANKDFITLQTSGNAYIKEAIATLVLPKVPTPNGDLALWSAILMDQQDFLQGVTENAKQSPYCDNLGNNWCNFAYTLVGSNPTVGATVAAAAGSRVTTHYVLNAQTQKWDQSVYIDGQLESTVSTSKGQKGMIFYISIECADGTCPDAPAHSWEDVSIVLSEADESFQHTGSWEYGATGGQMSTSDNGKTWNFTTLQVPETSIAYGQS
ncbi:hypothetical protein E8E14_002919 [Neopestalotiopsis sp. 37M]|nr:hypothetical protein E8E14_002919 [Neopestalotiopsis sp. 37M]